MNCPSCQAQLLEHLYDLLDDAERRAVQDHLDACPACRAELAKAKEQQRLLAAAARMEFPQVRFTAPAPEERVQPAPPPVLPLSAPATRKVRPWRRWAAAAAVLLALGGLAAPGWWAQQEYAEAGRIVGQKEAEASAARARTKDAVARLQALPAEERNKIEEVRKETLGRELKVAVVGPATVQSGAPTTYGIQTSNLNGQPVAAEVTARLAGADKQPMGAPIPVVKEDDGRYGLTLPPDLPVKPDDRLTLVVSAQRDAGIQAQASASFDLTAPVYVTHLDTDKPMYQPGDVVHFRSLTLDRFSLKPAEEPLRLTYELVAPTGAKKTLLQGVDGLRDLDGTEVLGPDKKPLRGVGAGELVLDPNAAGGEYSLVCREDNNRFPEQRRKFLVNNYPKPQLNKKLDFSRSTYGPGDEVAARCTAIRANGDPVRNQPVEATVLIDDQSYGADGKPSPQPLRFQTDDQGTVVVHFKLPPAIERGEASLGVKFLGAPVETITRPLPIVLKKLNVEFYPEGGDLAADLPNRVYFQVRTPLGKPADLNGELLEDGKPLPVAVETLHDDQEPGVNQGMGRFEFTPKSGKKYELQIDSPAGITDRVALPAVKDDGVALSVPDGVVAAGQPIKVQVRSKAERDLMVGLYCRGRLLQSVQMKKGETETTLNPDASAGGVCRVTVFEEAAAGPNRRELKPVAERLIYRRPAEQLTLDLRPDQSSYVPGQHADLHLETKNEKGEPAPAVVMLTVVDKSVLTLADEKTYRTMPTHFLLTSEVRRPEDLEYADFLLGPQAKAAPALDLLLGVQGWRRFVEQDPAKVRQKDGDKEEADRLLVMTGQSAPRRTELEAAVAQVSRDADVRAAQLKEQFDQAATAAAAVKADPAYVAAAARRAWYDGVLEQARVVGPPLLTAASLVGALAFLVLGLRRAFRRAVPWYAAAAASLMLMIAAVQMAPTAGRPAASSSAGDEVAQVEFPHLPALGAPPPIKELAEQEQEAALALDDFQTDTRLGAEVRGGANTAKTATAPATPPPPAAPAGAAGPATAAAKPAMRAAPIADKAGDDNAPANEPRRDGGQGQPGEKLAEKLRVNDRPEDEAKERQKDAADAKKADAPELADGLKWQDENAKREKDLNQNDARGGLLQRRNVEFFNRDREGAAGFQAKMLQPPLATMVVREYAYTYSLAPGGPRSDFAETLCWRPALVLPDGKIDVSFDLCDSATTFQALAVAHTLDGRLGAGVKVLESRLPFALQPAVPIEVTASDKIDVPLSVANNTPDRRDVRITVQARTNLNLLDDGRGGAPPPALSVDGGKTARQLYRFQPSVKEGEATLEFAGKADPFAADAVRARFRVAPEGFPVAESRSDLLEGSASQTVTLPDTWVKGTLKCQVQVFPSTLADLQKGLDSLLREPNGCFEQTSTSNYPNLLILDYLKASGQEKPEVERRAREMLSRGYQRLTSFECMKAPSQPSPSVGGGQGGGDREGYEWFGGTAPAHEALTAYGLLQFRDMAKVQDVDLVMLKRTQDYLMSRRDGKGGFLRNPRALDSFGRAPDDVTNAYIVWALTESGKDDDLTTELNALANEAKASKDPYFLSLVANSLINRARTDEATALLKTVAGVQKEDGHLDAEKTSITGSGGRDLQIETTALAVLGWLKANPGAFNGSLQKAVKWIGEQRGGFGGFGSTQSTILALKALIEYTKANKRTAEGGELRLFVGEKEQAKMTFAAGASDALTVELKDAESVLHPGPNAVRVEVTGKNVFPYTLAWTYQTLKPVAAEDCPVRLETKLSQTQVQEGDLVRLNVTLENISGKGQGMATAVIGLPGGLTVPEDMKQLKQHCREPEDGSRPLVSAFEIRGRELVLYWRDLAPGQKISVPLDLIARVPGEYTGPASRGYLYYNADHKDWVDPLRVVIAAKRE